MRNGKTAGLDGIRKEGLLVDPIMTDCCLTHVFNASQSSSKLPDAWKLAHINLLHKRGASDQPNSFRLISLASILCKLVKHIVVYYLNQSLDNFFYTITSIASEKVYRSRLRCTQTYHDIACCVDRDDSVHAVVMDFAKAFDRVTHRLLMGKLSRVANINSKILM